MGNSLKMKLTSANVNKTKDELTAYCRLLLTEVL